MSYFTPEEVRVYIEQQRNRGSWAAIWDSVLLTLQANVPLVLSVDRAILEPALRASLYVLPRPWWRRLLLRVGVWFLRRGT